MKAVRASRLRGAHPLFELLEAKVGGRFSANAETLSSRRCESPAVLPVLRRMAQSFPGLASPCTLRLVAKRKRIQFAWLARAVLHVFFLLFFVFLVVSNC